MESNEEKTTPRDNQFLGFLKSAGNTMLVPVLAVLTALIVGGIVIAAVGGNPFHAYLGLFHVITSYSIHYTKLYDPAAIQAR